MKYVAALLKSNEFFQNSSVISNALIREFSGESWHEFQNESFCDISYRRKTNSVFAWSILRAN